MLLRPLLRKISFRCFRFINCPKPDSLYRRFRILFPLADVPFLAALRKRLPRLLVKNLLTTRMFKIILKTKSGILICLLLCASLAAAQTKPQDPDDVVRVFTDLVQTDVMVFDKGGKFVKGLKREDFELKIDGKRKPLEFFEIITAGSVDEESQLAAARGSSRTAIPAGVRPLDRGRTVLFYVDDVHMDLASLNAAKKVIKHFLDNEQSQNDEAAIASTSGQIGFLQQLTDNRTVLNA